MLFSDGRVIWKVWGKIMFKMMLWQGNFSEWVVLNCFLLIFKKVDWQYLVIKVVGVIVKDKIVVGRVVMLKLKQVINKIISIGIFCKKEM